MSRYLVDYENVYIEGLTGLEDLTEDDEVCIFYTFNRCGMTFDLHKRLMNSKASIKLLEVASAPAKNPFSKASISSSVKNALDLQLTLYLGYLLATYKDEKEIFIISKDNDFGLDLEFCKNYLENSCTEVFLFPTIQNALEKDLPPQEEEKISEEDEQPEKEPEEESAEDEEENMALVNKQNTSLMVEEEYSMTLYNTVYNLINNKISEPLEADYIKSICRYIKQSEDLLALNNSLAALFHNGIRVKEIYHIIKPQFDLLKKF